MSDNQLAVILAGKDNQIRLLTAELAQSQARVEELETELAKWPRVYWESIDPKSIEDGYRVLSLAGRVDCDCDDSWLDVYVDHPAYDGNPFPAPGDFGLYSSSEAAEAAKETS